MLVACAALVLWAWWPRPQPDLPGPVPQERRRKLPTCKVPAEASPPPKLEVRVDMSEVWFGNAAEDGDIAGIAEDDFVTGCLYPAGGGQAEEWGQYWFLDYTPFLWPALLPEKQIRDVQDLAIRVAYDSTTHKVTRVLAYMRLIEQEANYGDVDLGLYTSGGALVGSTQTVRLYAGDWSWVEFPIDGDVEVDPEQSYWVNVWKVPGTAASWLWGRINSYLTPEQPLKISGSDTIVLSEALSGYGPGFAASDVLVLGEALGNYGPGFAASDVLAFEENLRHGGVIAPCDGRFIPPEPEEHCTNPHRWNG